MCVSVCVCVCLCESVLICVLVPNSENHHMHIASSLVITIIVNLHPYYMCVYLYSNHPCDSTCTK